MYVVRTGRLGNLTGIFVSRDDAIEGSEGTYEAVLNIYQEVDREKGPDMLDQLALGC